MFSHAVEKMKKSLPRIHYIFLEKIKFRRGFKVKLSVPITQNLLRKKYGTRNKKHMDNSQHKSLDQADRQRKNAVSRMLLSDLTNGDYGNSEKNLKKPNVFAYLR